MRGRGSGPHLPAQRQRSVARPPLLAERHLIVGAIRRANRSSQSNPNHHLVSPPSPGGITSGSCKFNFTVGHLWNLIKESTAEAFGFEIVVDDFGYNDYIDADESFVLPPDIVGLTCFSPPP